MYSPIDRYVPESALILYNCDRQSDGQSTSFQGKIYIEAHRINGRGELMEGKPLGTKDMSDLCKRLQETTLKMPYGRLPSNLLYLSWNVDLPELLWYTPPQKVRCLYEDTLKIPNGTIQIPGLVWFFSYGPKGMRLYAYKDWQDDETVLYRAPFHNISADGDVCMGSGAKHLEQQLNIAKIIPMVEHVFWNTKFSHLNHNGNSKGNLNTLHHRLVTKQIPFPLDELMAYTSGKGKKQTELKLKNLFSNETT